MGRFLPQQIDLIGGEFDFLWSSLCQWLETGASAMCAALPPTKYNCAGNCYCSLCHICNCHDLKSRLSRCTLPNFRNTSNKSHIQHLIQQCRLNERAVFIEWDNLIENNVGII